MLRRKGWQVNVKNTRIIYNELVPDLRNKHPQLRAKAKLRADRQEAVGRNEVWAMDFFMTNWPWVTNCGSRRSWIRHPLFSGGSPTLHLPR